MLKANKRILISFMNILLILSDSAVKAKQKSIDAPASPEWPVNGLKQLVRDSNRAVSLFSLNETKNKKKS